MLFCYSFQYYYLIFIGIKIITYIYLYKNTHDYNNILILLLLLLLLLFIIIKNNIYFYQRWRKLDPERKAELEKIAEQKKKEYDEALKAYEQSENFRVILFYK